VDFKQRRGKFSGYGTVITDEEMGKIKLLPNMVLIRPTSAFVDCVEETESGLLISWPSKSGYTRRPEAHAIMRARVMAVADKLVWADKLRTEKGMAQARLEIESEIDVIPGDIVMTSYRAIQFQVDRGCIFTNDNCDTFYVMVNYDRLVMRERAGIATPLNGYHVVEPKKLVLSTKVYTFSSKEPVESVIIKGIPKHAVKRYWWEEIYNKRVPAGGYRPIWDEEHRDANGFLVRAKITGYQMKGKSSPGSTYGYRDHGIFSAGMEVYARRNSTIDIDNEILFADRTHKYQGLKRLSEKDIVAFKDATGIHPNKLRLKIVPDPAPDHYDRLKNLQIPRSQASLPHTGTVVEVWVGDEVTADLLGKRVAFIGGRRPEAPELIIKENGVTMFIYHINQLV